MTVLPGWRRRETDDVECLDLAHHLLECDSRKVMALVDNHVAVIGDEILDLLLLVKALKNRDIDPARPVRLAAADLPNVIDGQIQNIASLSRH